MYGSSFCIRTRSPRRSSSMPIDALVQPFAEGADDAAGQTKICLVIRCGAFRDRGVKEGGNRSSV